MTAPFNKNNSNNLTNNSLSGLEDTSPENKELYFQLLRSLTTEERFHKMVALCSYGRQVLVESVKKENPNSSPEELKIRVAERLHGKEFVKKFLKNG